MSEHTPPAMGTIGWTDIAVPDAVALRTFYETVAGWTSEPLDMGGYDDYVMKSPDGRAVAGVCHARGPNAALPPVWLNYITVPDVAAAVERCTELGGTVIAPPKKTGPGAFAIIRDPASAVVGLYQGEESKE